MFENSSNEVLRAKSLSFRKTSITPPETSNLSKKLRLVKQNSYLSQAFITLEYKVTQKALKARQEPKANTQLSQKRKLHFVACQPKGI